MPDILHQVQIEATPGQVFRALTEREGLGSWWTRDVVAEPEVGSVAQFGFNRRLHLLDVPRHLSPHCGA